MPRSFLTPCAGLLASFAIAAFAPPCAPAQEYHDGGRGGVPLWEVDPAFKHDVFTFARIRYSNRRGRFGGGGWGRGGGDWATDFPDAELNLGFRLQQMTSIKVNPQAAVVDLATDDLSHFPFLYMVEPGRLVFEDEELEPLRRHLLTGGFLMVDDFWGDDEYENFHYEIKRVFPDRELVELPLDHAVFHCVFELKAKPQIPHLAHALQHREEGITWEFRRGSPTSEVHIQGMFDEKGRMMMIVCHNTDLGDGWEREGESAWYFHEFAEQKAYPMGINIIFYAMTH